MDKQIEQDERSELDYIKEEKCFIINPLGLKVEEVSYYDFIMPYFWKMPRDIRPNVRKVYPEFDLYHKNFLQIWDLYPFSGNPYLPNGNINHPVGEFLEDYLMNKVIRDGQINFNEVEELEREHTENDETRYTFRLRKPLFKVFSIYFEKECDAIAYQFEKVEDFYIEKTKLSDCISSTFFSSQERAETFIDEHLKTKEDQKTPKIKNYDRVSGNKIIHSRGAGKALKYRS